MATIQRPVEQAAAVKPAEEPGGWSSWLTTVDHKKIGIMYLVVAFFFFIIGGIEALLMRIQLGAPNNTFLSPEAYNQIFTMHATTMIFLGIMPLNVGFGNYVVPIMIGARDMAFPRLNALSIWLFIFGGLMLYSSFILGGAPSAGWFSYVPLSNQPYSSTHGMDYWIIGLTVTGVASIAGALNFIVTIINLRAPGMSFNRMPLFVWMTLVVSFLLVFAFPSLTVAQFQLFFDRNFGTTFFKPSGGGDPLLWQHLFWFFGHPEVYILILPAMGVVSEVLPTFSRKPIFGYAFVAYSGVAIGFLGFTVWAHHMFAVGMSSHANTFFALITMAVGIPTGIKIFNWLATLWGGKIRFATPMLWCIGFLLQFLIAGLTGVMLAAAPFDWQLTDSYFVVAHFHYVLVGAIVMTIFAAIYYWFPKATGRMLSERLGRWHFWLFVIGFHVTFDTMHFPGLLGMPRRIYTYEPDRGWGTLNLIITIGVVIQGAAILIFLWNIVRSLAKGRTAGNDPWDAWTLEWAVTSPPPAYNFAKLPVVGSRRPLWDFKHPDDPDWRYE